MQSRIDKLLGSVVGTQLAPTGPTPDARRPTPDARRWSSRRCAESRHTTTTR
jgi:hypothetical protein